MRNHREKKDNLTEAQKAQIREEFNKANRYWKEGEPDYDKMRELLEKYYFLRREIDLDDPNIITLLNDYGVSVDLMDDMDILHNKGGGFEVQFIRHLLKNHNPGTDYAAKPNRRLDSLARILENDGTCTAVYLDSGRLLIASNSITSGSRDGVTASAHYRLIGRVMEYFESCTANNEPNWQERKNLILELSGNVLKTKLRYEGTGDIENDLQIFYDDFYSREPLIHTKAWRDEMLLGVIDAKKKEVIRQLSRIIRDFRKLETTLLSDEVDKEDKERVFTTHISNGEAGYEILRIGTAKTHAEMKILEKIIEGNYQRLSEENSEEYIGISKLCCAHCMCVISSLFDRSLVRGEHGKSFGWDLPGFLNDEVNVENFKKFVGKNAFKLFQEMDPTSQSEALEFIKNPDLSADFLREVQRYHDSDYSPIVMEAEDSSSDEEIELAPIIAAAKHSAVLVPGRRL